MSSTQRHSGRPPIKNNQAEANRTGDAGRENWTSGPFPRQHREPNWYSRQCNAPNRNACRRGGGVQARTACRIARTSSRENFEARILIGGRKKHHSSPTKTGFGSAHSSEISLNMAFINETSDAGVNFRANPPFAPIPGELRMPRKCREIVTVASSIIRTRLIPNAHRANGRSAIWVWS